MNFKKDKYKIIKKAISPDLGEFCFNYLQNKTRAVKHMFDVRYLSPYDNTYGIFNDIQAPNTYSCYADVVMETLLMGLVPKMEKETDLKLFPNYSYTRLYQKDDILVRHTDRYSCEVSTTLFLGGDKWPIYLDVSGQNNNSGIKVDLEQGDMLIYRGADLQHWREPFKGDVCAQAFFHYNDASDKNAETNKFDRRPFIGLPNYFIRGDEKSKNK